MGREYRPLNLTRVRCLGGVSNHWGGICRELDASDFEPRPANPKSGWPITKADLEGYAAEADDILDLPAPRPAQAYLPSNVYPFTPMIFRFSPRTRFGAKFREELARSLRIKLYLNANLVDIKLDDARRSVLQASFCSFDKEGTFTVKAKYFVLCLGGIENPRILLNCQGGISSGDRKSIWHCRSLFRGPLAFYSRRSAIQKNATRKAVRRAYDRANGQ